MDYCFSAAHFVETEEHQICDACETLLEDCPSQPQVNRYTLRSQRTEARDGDTKILFSRETKHQYCASRQPSRPN
jgi:hypothetical protein